MVLGNLSICTVEGAVFFFVVEKRRGAREAETNLARLSKILRVGKEFEVSLRVSRDSVL